MQIIGVVDLRGGRAVHARAGQRDRYEPVHAAAGRDIQGDAVALARVYLDRLGVDELYAADLDAILEGEPQDAAVAALARLGARLWIDSAISSVDRARRALDLGAARAIVGLETLPSYDTLRDIAAFAGERTAFSLDLRAGIPIASAAIGSAPAEAIAARAADAGARAVIVIDLARVGTRAGPDFELLTRVRAAIPGLTLVAGGGVRGPDDLRRLAESGCDGALAATALLDGRLTAADVAAARRDGHGTGTR